MWLDRTAGTAKTMRMKKRSVDASNGLKMFMSEETGQIQELNNEKRMDSMVTYQRCNINNCRVSRSYAVVYMHLRETLQPVRLPERYVQSCKWRRD